MIGSEEQVGARDVTRIHQARQRLAQIVSSGHRLPRWAVASLPPHGRLITMAVAVTDLVPLLLFSGGLPVARDMDGRVLTEAFDPRTATWTGRGGSDAVEAVVNRDVDMGILRQLVEDSVRHMRSEY